MNKTVSPIVVEIIRNALNSAAHEMNNCLARSAFSPLIYEMKDCSVGIFDTDGEMLGQSAGLPIFLGNLDICIKILNEKVGLENYKEGDLYIMNDSYMQGTHVGDFTSVSPIFYNGQLVGFTATRAAMLDVGAKAPGGVIDSTDIYQEGIRIPPVKLYDGGVLREDVLDFIALNSRFHAAMKGDIGAQIAASRTGEKRFCEILDRFGLDVVKEAAKEIFRQAEALDRKFVESIPDGEYYAEGYLDNDNYDLEHHVKVCAKVIVQGDEMTVDLTGSNPATRGAVNCGFAQTIAAARVAFKELSYPEGPICGGNFRNLNVIVPPKSIFAAEEPAPCQWYFSSLGLLIDMLVKALAEVVPDKASGAHYGDSMVVFFYGTNPKRGNEFFTSCEATVGGWGGFKGGDGENALINMVNGDFKNLPVEFVEHKYPLEVQCYKIRQDSEGAGRFRGGCGVVRQYKVNTDDCAIGTWFERSVTPAWGLLGGQDAQPPVVIINPDTDEEMRVMKAADLHIKRGTVVRLLTGGGGGYGDPRERDPDSIRSDVENGYISPVRAEKVYGWSRDTAEG